MRESLWRLVVDFNMVVSGGGGVLMELMGCTGWVSRNSLRVERSFLDLLYLR